MSIYIMSDIHGKYDKFIAMLNKIEFKDEDKLYILGDIFDRGEKPLEILEYIVKRENIVLLKGNHEEMFIEAYENDFRDLQLWFMNGGTKTYYALCEKGDKYIEEAYRYIKRLNTSCSLNYGDFTYLLCHAGANIPQKRHGELYPDLVDIMEHNSDEDLLWSREHLNSYHILENVNIICGHTPTQNIKIEDKNTGMLVYGEPKVIQRGSFIYIDCGACFDSGKLACIELMERVDGYKSYYI